MSSELVTIVSSFGGVLAVLKALSLAYHAKANAAAKKDEVEAALLQSTLDRVKMLEAQVMMLQNKLEQIELRAQEADRRAYVAVTELAEWRRKAQR
jgi:hypothetical protein